MRTSVVVPKFGFHAQHLWVFWVATRVNGRRGVESHRRKKKIEIYNFFHICTSSSERNCCCLQLSTKFWKSREESSGNFTKKIRTFSNGIYIFLIGGMRAGVIVKNRKTLQNDTDGKGGGMMTFRTYFASESQFYRFRDLGTRRKEDQRGDLNSTGMVSFGLARRNSTGLLHLF